MKSKDRIVYLADCDSFFASVEETFHPEYKKVPMAIAGDPENRRGIILAKNQLAKKAGVKTAETINDARRKCPNLVLAPPRHNTYGEFCDRVNSIYEQYTDQVERVSVDESFLDVTGSLHLFGSNPVELANEIRQRVEQEIGITISIGISWCKVFAKVASDINKPNGVCLVTRENYKDVVWKLPIADMYGVGKKSREALEKSYIKTIGDLAGADVRMLSARLGKSAAEHLHNCTNGLDDSQVALIGQEEPIKSVGNGRTFKRDLKTEHDIKMGVIALADMVASRLRKRDLKCGTIQVTIKDTALKSIQRQKAAKHPTYLAAEITETAMEIIKASWPAGKPIRLLTITAQNLMPADQACEQLNLFDKPADNKGDKAEKIELAMDKIRNRYGRHSIQLGAIYKNDLGISDHDEEDEE
jgi:DNA polymerase-4